MLHFKPTILLGLLASLLTSSLMLATPAQAQSWTTDDPSNRRLYAGDISNVTVHHRDRKVIVRVDFNDRIYDAVDAWIDTPGTRRGPQMVAQYDRSYGEWHGLRRATRDFGTRQLLECDAMTTSLNSAEDTLRMAVPRRCLSTDGVAPERLRVSIDSRDETYSAHDWAPGRQDFGPWVTAG